MDYFIYIFTTYTGTPANKIPSLVDINIKSTVSNYWSLIYFNSPHDSDIKTISEITIITATTNSVGHTDLREYENAGGGYTGEEGGYHNRRLPNGNRCLKSSLWYCHGCLIWF